MAEYTPTSEDALRELRTCATGFGFRLSPEDFDSAIDQVRADERAKRPDREQIARAVKRVSTAFGGPSMQEFADDPPVRKHYAIADAVLALEPEAREEPSAVAKADADTLARVMAKVYEPDLDWDNPTDFDLLDRETLTDSARRILERMKWSGLTFWHMDDLVLDEFDPAPRPAPEAREVTDAVPLTWLVTDSQVIAAREAFLEADADDFSDAMRKALEAAREVTDISDVQVEAAAKAIILELLRTIGTASTFEEVAAAQMPMARREARAALEAAREVSCG